MERAGFDSRNGCLNQYRRFLDAAQVVGGKFKDGDPASGEVLLVTDVLVGRDEKGKPRFGLPQQVAVF